MRGTPSGKWMLSHPRRYPRQAHSTIASPPVGCTPFEAEPAPNKKARVIVHVGFFIWRGFGLERNAAYRVKWLVVLTTWMLSHPFPRRRCLAP